ncbi:MAG: transposase [candidate division WOR-3 bacterium]
MRTNPITIKQIFKDHWPDYLTKNPNTPDYVIKQVEKMLACRNPQKLGYHVYQCQDHPWECKFIPNTCKSRFCNSCGKKATDEFIAKLQTIFPATPFHHITFTIPDSLRELFNKNRFLLNCLFIAAAKTILSYYQQKKKILPLITAALHTFGRKVNFNCHIHLFVTAIGLVLENGKPTNHLTKCTYIPFAMLHKRYRYLLIASLKKTIKKYLKNPQPHYYADPQLSVFNHPGTLDTFFDPLLEINWYVHDSQELPPERLTIPYAVRYSKRPPIAESRIIRYELREDFNSQWCVTFTCKPHNQREFTETRPALDFIKLLIQHILPPHFRQIRYYGVLSNRIRKQLLPTVFAALAYEQELIRQETWRERQINLTGIDPLACPICHKPMKLVEVVYFSSTLGFLRSYRPP